MPYGHLEVTVVEGKKLKETEFFDKANPYVSLSLDKHNKQKTRAIQNAGSGATWNEKFIFDVLEGRYELYVEVLDDEIGSDDDLIGGASVPLIQVFQQGYIDSWFSITRPSGKPAGEIHLSMNFMDQGPTSGPPGHTPYPVPNGPGYFSPPNSGSSTHKSYLYSENQAQQVQQEVISSLGPEGGAIPSDYGSGAPPNVITPESTDPPVYPTGFPKPSLYGANVPNKFSSSDQYHDEKGQ